MEILLIVGIVGIAAVALSGGVSLSDLTGGSSGTGATLTPSQIARYAQNAGFSGSDLVMAVAIALAESSGRTGIPGDSGTSIGLWQIHTTAHPEFSSWDLTDPQQNANAAFQIYSAAGNTFRDWTTYGNGAASNYFGQASAGVTAMQQGA